MAIKRSQLHILVERRLITNMQDNLPDIWQIPSIPYDTAEVT